MLIAAQQKKFQTMLCKKQFRFIRCKELVEKLNWKMQNHALKTLCLVKVPNILTDA